MNGDGQMDINEFSIACKLITNKLKGKKIDSKYSERYLIDNVSENKTLSA